jgi:hypothetical protein
VAETQTNFSASPKPWQELLILCSVLAVLWDDPKFYQSAFHHNLHPKMSASLWEDCNEAARLLPAPISPGVARTKQKLPSSGAFGRSSQRG